MRRRLKRNPQQMAKHWVGQWQCDLAQTEKSLNSAAQVSRLLHKVRQSFLMIDCNQLQSMFDQYTKSKYQRNIPLCKIKVNNIPIVVCSHSTSRADREYIANSYLRTFGQCPIHPAYFVKLLVPEQILPQFAMWEVDLSRWGQYGLQIKVHNISPKDSYALDDYSVTRIFHFTDLGYVEHAAITIGRCNKMQKGQWVGNGWHKTIFLNELALYRALHLRYIRIIASDIGVYAWGKYGFEPDSMWDWHSLLLDIANDLKQQYQTTLPPSVIADLKQQLLSTSALYGTSAGLRFKLGDRFPIKKCVLGSINTWSGHYDLLNAKTVARTIQYCLQK